MENKGDTTEVEEPQEQVEPEQEPEAEPAPETAEPSPQKPTDEMKIIIVMKADRAMLGVQSPDCDPVYTTIEGSLAMALKKVPALVKEAKQKWEANPRYPKADLPTPEPSSTPTRTTAAPKEKKAQPSFF